MVRLDAVGYAIKKAGNSCFMMPETFDFIAEFAGAGASALGIEVLVEIHAYYQRQIEIAQQVDWVYDFALPPLVLHALFFGTSRAAEGAGSRMRPNNALTVLDTHDGIGIIDIGADAGDRAGTPGLVPPAATGRAGRAHPRQQRRRQPPGHRRGGLQPRPVPGQLHLLRRAGPQRRGLPAGARHPVLPARACRRSTTSACWPARTTWRC